MDSEPDAPTPPRTGQSARPASARPAAKRPANAAPAAKKPAAAARKPAQKPVAKPAVKPAAKPAVKPAVKPAAAKTPAKPATARPAARKPPAPITPVELVETPADEPQAAEPPADQPVIVDEPTPVPEPQSPSSSGPSFRLSFSPISRPSLGRFSAKTAAPVETQAEDPEAPPAETPPVEAPPVEPVETEAEQPEPPQPDTPQPEAPQPDPPQPDTPPAETPPAETPPVEPVETEAEDPEPSPVDTPLPEQSPPPVITGPVSTRPAIPTATAAAARRAGAKPATTSKNPSSDVALSVRGLTKRFGSTVAVDAADLEVKAGSFYGFVGPNGAGKTTTLSMVTGLLRPDAGIVKVYGADVWRNQAVAKRMLGVLPDRLRLFDRLTGAEYLHHAGGLRGLDRETTISRTADLVAAFGLEHSLHRFVSDYSAGMIKKIAIAAAMIHSPRLLVLDEPFESVDPVSAQVVIDILKKFTAAGGTVLLSSHSMDLIQRVCDSVAIIADGRMLASGTFAEVLEGRSLEDRFIELAGGATAVEGMEWLHSYSD